MVINDVPIIVDSVRDQLSAIFIDQFNECSNNVNYLLSYPDSIYAHEFDYHNIFKPNHNNLVRHHNGNSMMSVFNFSIRNSIKIYKLLQIEKFRPTINGIRVFAGETVPMHVDLNKGEIGRENPIYSIVVSGSDGVVFMSNRKDGSRLVAIPGKTEFVMYPTMVEHGAIAGAENYDVVQIQLSGLL